MLDDFPQELLARNQWVNWTFEDVNGAITKVPRQPATGYRADITRPDHWSDAATAIANVERGLCSGVGYAIAADDGYTFIDLDGKDADETQIETLKEVIRNFASYTEVSPSGKGWHIIVRGKLPLNVKTKFIEIYSSQRYMTCTGNVYINEPIQDATFKLEELARSLGAFDKNSGPVEDHPEVISDDELMTQAASAKNGDLFLRLFSGDITGYSSQSEADQALMNIIAYYTDNHAQTIRVFKRSELGKRAKAQRADYLQLTARKSFDQKIPRVYIEQALQQTREQIEAAPATAQAPHRTAFGVPPGIMGEFARFVYANAPRPVPEIAIAAAIGMMSSIGRAYNVSRTGLNLYTMLVAPTGTGKEAVHRGITEIVESMRTANTLKNGPASLLGPSDFASVQGLLRTFAKQKSFVSCVGEFGLRLSAMASQRAAPNEKAIMRTLLDIYQKSGKGQKLLSTAYADKANNIEDIEAPSLSIVGETTPQTLKEQIDESVITSGLFPRFIVIEYTGARVPVNPHMGQTPLSNIDHIRAFFMHAIDRIVRDDPQEVYETPEATALLRQIDDECDAKINAGPDVSELDRHLWTRVKLNVQKLAALVAVGCDYLNPLVTREHVEWAQSVVMPGVERLAEQFRRGDFGAAPDDANRQLSDIARIMTRIHVNGVAPHRVVMQRVYKYASIRKARRSPQQAIRDAIQVFVDSGVIMEINSTMARQYNISGKAYVIQDWEGLNSFIRDDFT